MATAPALPRIEFTLNGEAIRVDAAETHVTLLDFLRARGLTGAKEGCAEGECGACTVAMVANENGRAAYRAVNSCLVLLPTIAGHEICTVESLASAGALSEAQQAMAAAGGSQCGYCTPGMVMAAKWVLDKKPDATRQEIAEALSGQLCRCTGYIQIYEAVEAAAAVLRGEPAPAPRLAPVLQGGSRERPE